MSSALVWELVKKNNSFLVKRDGATFTKEAGNLTQLSTPRYSGVSNTSAVGICFADKSAKKKVRRT